MFFVKALILLQHNPIDITGDSEMESLFSLDINAIYNTVKKRRRQKRKNRRHLQKNLNSFKYINSEIKKVSWLKSQSMKGGNADEEE